MIYFDNAASSWPKPPDVLKEVELTMRFRGGNPSRGGHTLSKVAGQTVYRCREKLAEHFGEQPERVIFTPGATYALNFVMKSVIGEGDHFLISDMEHNAVLRVAYALQKKGAMFDTFDAAAAEQAMLAEIRSKVRKNTVALVCIHASNVVPLTLPIEEIARQCSRMGILCIVDAAQSAGHREIRMDSAPIDALCLPGHKGLLGPQGCGCIILSPKMAKRMECGRTLIEGGSGILSEDTVMPSQLPERYEPGTQPTPLIAGLYAGVRFLERIGYNEIVQRERDVYSVLKEGLLNMDGVILYMPSQADGNLLLFNVEGISTSKLGNYFDTHGVCLRSGFHCAPMAHRKLQTGSEGAIRISIGWNNTKKEAVSFLCSLYRVIKELK